MEVIERDKISRRGGVLVNNYVIRRGTRSRKPGRAGPIPRGERTYLACWIRFHRMQSQRTDATKIAAKVTGLQMMSILDVSRPQYGYLASLHEFQQN